MDICQQSHTEQHNQIDLHTVYNRKHAENINISIWRSKIRTHLEGMYIIDNKINLKNALAADAQSKI